MELIQDLVARHPGRVHRRDSLQLGEMPLALHHFEVLPLLGSGHLDSFSGVSKGPGLQNKGGREGDKPVQFDSAARRCPTRDGAHVRPRSSTAYRAITTMALNETLCDT